MLWGNWATGSSELAGHPPNTFCFWVFLSFLDTWHATGVANTTRPRCLHFLPKQGLDYSVMETLDFWGQPVRSIPSCCKQGGSRNRGDLGGRACCAVCDCNRGRGPRKPQQQGKNRLTLSDSFSSWIGRISPLLAIWLGINSSDTRLKSLK